jgi:ribosome-associated translation inhibitor RaiA
MIRGLRMTVAHLKKQMDRRFTRLRRDLSHRFADVDARFDAVGARFADVDARFDAVDARFADVDARFDAVDARFDASDARMRAGFESLHDKLDSLARSMKQQFTEQKDHYDLVIGNYENRLRDLERSTRT